MRSLHNVNEPAQGFFTRITQALTWPIRRLMEAWDPPADLSTIPGIHATKRLQLTPVTTTELLPNKPAVLVYVYASTDSRNRQNHRRAILFGIAYTDSELRSLIEKFDSMPWILHNLVALEDENNRILHRKVEARRDFYSTFTALSNARIHLLGGTPAPAK